MSRSRWTAVIVRTALGGHYRRLQQWLVQDVMLGAVERRFGSAFFRRLSGWLTDNGSCYRANEEHASSPDVGT